MIKRERIIKSIRPFYFAMDIVKVITGIRRAGKSVLLSQIADELRNGGIAEDKIIFMNLELLEHSELTDHMELYKFIKSKIRPAEKYFVFFDEIQLVDKFELLINSLRAGGNISLFVTGSNAHLFSGELATRLAGRYVQFFVTPFTFSEALRISAESDRKKAFAKYMKWGGLPGHFAFENENEKQKYVQDVYNSVVLRDIVQRSGIRDLNLLENIIQFIVENTGTIFSANTISKYLKSQNRNVSAEALYNYVGHLTNSLLFNKVNRFDIRGKNVFSTLEKYYSADLGLLQIRRSLLDNRLGARFETIIANELLARGYRIYVGVRRNSEIDFAAEKNGELEFIQAAYGINSDETLKRELEAFDGIAERKTLITGDDYDYSTKGIKSVNAIDWLLGEENNVV
jgi:predicted AAA+ superfamily ATPase